MKLCREKKEQSMLKECFFFMIILSGIILNFTAFLSNILIQETPEITFISFIATITFSLILILFYILPQKNFIATLTFLLVILGLIPLIWFYDGGLKGVTPFYLFLVLIMTILLFSSWLRYFLASLLIVVTAVLVLLEKLNPDWVIYCENPLCKESNHVVAILITLIFTFILLSLFANNYEGLHMVSRKKEKELEEKNAALQELARIDPLTRLSNRRDIEEKTRYQQRISKRDKERFSFIMCDIDDFKKINDKYGHAVGDYILKELAKITKRSIREQSTASRWGGEEFLILIPYCLSKEAKNIAERIRKAVEEHKFIFNKHIINLTISLGVSEYDFEYPSIKRYIEKADRAMYISKAKGKNRVSVVT